MIPHLSRLLLMMCVSVRLLSATEHDIMVKRLVALEYPRLASLAVIQGTVVIRCKILSDGVVESATLISGHKLLGEAAIENVKKWRFEVRTERTPPPITFDLIYTFVLQGVSFSSVCKTTFSFEYPNFVTVVGPAEHWQPQKRKNKR